MKPEHTIRDFEKQFPDDAACLEWIRRRLYPEKILCTTCKRPAKHHRIRTRKVYGCDFCGRQVSPTAGTIFHKSSTPLRLWVYAIFLMSNTRCGISAKQLERELGVTYKTAWRMFRQIRSLLQGETGRLSGEVKIRDQQGLGRGVDRLLRKDNTLTLSRLGLDGPL